MPPIDPQQLLKALGPLLTNSGGIKGSQEAFRITSLMKDASKLVTRCVYLNIVRATDSKDALQRFMDVGGWDILNSWLEIARDDNNEPLLAELLEVYSALPVTVGLLKQNSAAKTIKQLSKADKEKIKNLSSTLVDSWTKLIRDQKVINDSAEEKRKQKKPSEKEKQKEKEQKKSDKENEKKDAKVVSDNNKTSSRQDRNSKDRDKNRSHKDSRDKEKNKEKDEKSDKRNERSKSVSNNKEVSSFLSSLPSSKHSLSDSSLSGKGKDTLSASKRQSSLDDSSRTSNSSISDSSVINKNQDSGSSKDEPRRVKTVKRIVTSFRSTGLFEEDEEEEAESKKAVEKPQVKRPVLDTKIEESVGKKPRLQLTMPTLSPANSEATVTTPPEINHGRIKLIAPKKLPAHEIQESNVFMDALQQSTLSGGIKKKKKLASPSSAGVTTNPALFKAPSAVSPPSTASSPPGSMSPPLNTYPVTEVGPTSPPLLSPTTVMAQKLPSVPSFYRDTLEDLPEMSNDIKKDQEDEDESPPPLVEMEAAEIDVSRDSKEGEVPMETSSTPEMPPDIRTNISPVSEPVVDVPQKVEMDKRSKKCVTWAREAILEEIFYFELDETERENVNRPKSFSDMKKAEMLLDRRCMESVKRFNNDTMVEVLQWKRPKFIDSVIVLVEPGSSSVEKHIQMEREQVVLCALFFNKIPDTPIEPDPDLNSDKVETKLIPLEDENGSCTEYEHTYTFNDPSSLPYDPEFGGLPLQNHGPNMNPGLNSMGGVGNMRGPANIPPAISHLLNTLQQQAQESRDPVMQNLQGILTNVMQTTNPQDSGMLVERILSALEPFKNQIPGLSNLISSVTGGNMDPSMAGPRFMMANQIGNPRHGLLGSAPPGFNMMSSNMRPAIPGPPGPIMGNGNAMGGNPNYYMGSGGGGGGSGGGGGGGGSSGGNMRMSGPPGQWRGPGRGRPYHRGGHRPVVCQYFVNKGMCKYGDGCQFIHPSPNS